MPARQHCDRFVTPCFAVQSHRQAGRTNLDTGPLPIFGAEKDPYTESKMLKANDGSSNLGCHDTEARKSWLECLVLSNKHTGVTLPNSTINELCKWSLSSNEKPLDNTPLSTPSG